jgi:hypothetical protein
MLWAILIVVLVGFNGVLGHLEEQKARRRHRK